MSEPNFDLFLSFSSRDSIIQINGKPVRVIDELKRALESHYNKPTDEKGKKNPARRFRVCTYEEDFELEETVQAAMRETVENCSFLLVVTSEAAAQSHHIRFELETFTALRREGERLLAAQLSVAPEKAFPEFFAPDALAANLTLAADMNVKDWRRQLLRESHKIVARVWNLPLEEVFNRFEQQRKRQQRLIASWSATALLVIAAIFIWYNSELGFHQTGSFPGEELRENTVLAGFPANSDNEFFTFHQDHLHRWNIAQPEQSKKTEFKGFTNQAALVGTGTAIVAQGKQLLLYDLESGEAKQLFSAEDFIERLSIYGERWAAVSKGRLLLGNLTGEVREAPRPEVTIGRHFPPEFQERSALRYGEQPLFCDDGKFLITASFTGQLVVLNPNNWEFFDPQNIVVYEAQDSRPLTGLAYDRRLRRLIFFEGGRMHAFSLEAGKVIQLNAPEIGVVNHAAFTPDGEYLIASTPYAVHWFRRNGDQFTYLEQDDADPFLVTGLLVSPSGKSIVVGGYNEHARLFKHTLRIFGVDILSF
jgi:hypothetical protein